MKETIYTIPINEAFDNKCTCALCVIENRLEKEEIEYTLGPAMMEPDFRINSNKKGFCKAHYKGLLENSKALPLALVLQTHIQQQNKEIFNKKIEKNTKSSIFKKQSAEVISSQKITQHIDNLKSSCIVCERINDTMNRYMENLIYIWKTQKEFRHKFSVQESFCLPHFSLLLKYASDGLNGNDFNDFYHSVMEIQEKAQTQYYNDISEFTMLFDHNNTSTPTQNVKNSIKRTIKNVSGLNCEND